MLCTAAHFPYNCYSHDNNYTNRFRFTYPDELIATIKDCITATGTVVDIGCGTGQSILPWIGVFDKCIGTDISEAQIACAKDNIRNVEFVTCSSDKIPLPDKSVDLVTCGQAWHWLDHSSTIPEIRRILKSPGRVAVYGYGNIIMRNSSAEALVREFYSTTLKGYWHINRTHIDQMYSGLPMIFPTLVKKVFHVNKTMQFDDFFGYINTWSGYITYKEKNPDSCALDVLRKRLHEIIERDIIDIAVPYFLYISKSED